MIGGEHSFDQSTWWFERCLNQQNDQHKQGFCMIQPTFPHEKMWFERDTGDLTVNFWVFQCWFNIILDNLDI